MSYTTTLQRWKLLPFLILLTSSALSCVESSYSVRDDEGCQESSSATCTRSPACTVNHSSRGGVTQRCSDLQVPGRLPRPTAWLLVALLSALGGATACWLANLLAPPPGYGQKTNTQRSSRAHRLPVDAARTQHRMRQQAGSSLGHVQGDLQHDAT